MASLLLLNGPNLDRLGERETALYGHASLSRLESRLSAIAQHLGHELRTFQSNAEHELIQAVHRASDEGIAFAIVNPAAFTHTSIALRDAFSAVELPFIEVHITNVHAREPFRGHSYFSDIAVGTIVGLGTYGYELALRAASACLAGENRTD